ncbi:hypothetical protein GJ496_001331 [Pomphorhynchus laevis]|nr:hypothetical protein GJ496_001331 [Pomphorhynchus laevis]
MELVKLYECNYVKAVKEFKSAGMKKEVCNATATAHSTLRTASKRKMDIDKDMGDWIINNSNNKNRRLSGLVRQEKDENMQQKNSEITDLCNKFNCIVGRKCRDRGYDDKGVIISESKEDMQKFTEKRNGLCGQEVKVILFNDNSSD